jgi:hypothetical protein
MGLLDDMKKKMAELPQPAEKPKREPPKSPLLEKINEKMKEVPTVAPPRRDTGKPPYLLYQIQRQVDKDKRLTVQVTIELDDLIDRTRTALQQFLDCLIVHQDVMRPMIGIERVRVVDCVPGDDKSDGKIVLEVVADAEPLLE